MRCRAPSPLKIPQGGMSGLGPSGDDPSRILTVEEREAAYRLIKPLFDALSKSSDADLALAFSACLKASQTNCWWALFAMRHELPGLIALEQRSRCDGNEGPGT